MYENTCCPACRSAREAKHVSALSAPGSDTIGHDWLTSRYNDCSGCRQSGRGMEALRRHSTCQALRVNRVVRLKEVSLHQFVGGQA